MTIVHVQYWNLTPLKDQSGGHISPMIHDPQIFMIFNHNFYLNENQLIISATIFVLAMMAAFWNEWAGSWLQPNVILLDWDFRHLYL